jgi:nitrogen fixation NifU-like protein
MMDLRDLYQDIILDHGQHPRNFRVAAHPSHLAHGHNPLCGDKVTVYVTMGADGKIADVSFQGRGCAISQASASLMTEILRGKTLAEADALFKGFHAKVTGGAEPALASALGDDMERLQPLTGVKAYPARVKCATLAWHAFESALRGGATVKTE